MKRLIAGLLTILGILATAGVGVDAAPKAIWTEEVGPYEGTFEGQTVRGDPRRLMVNPTFDIGGLDLEVGFESKVSADGEVITARAKVDLPWFCGRDPVLRATLYKD
jgi:hypothetical protein